MSSKARLHLPDEPEKSKENAISYLKSWRAAAFLIAFAILTIASIFAIFSAITNPYKAELISVNDSDLQNFTMVYEVTGISPLEFLLIAIVVTIILLFWTTVSYLPNLVRLSVILPAFVLSITASFIALSGTEPQELLQKQVEESYGLAYQTKDTFLAPAGLSYGDLSIAPISNEGKLKTGERTFTLTFLDSDFEKYEELKALADKNDNDG